MEPRLTSFSPPPLHESWPFAALMAFAFSLWIHCITFICITSSKTSPRMKRLGIWMKRSTKTNSFRPCECNGKALSNHDEICWKATPPRSNHPTKEKKYQTSSAVEDRTMAVQIFIKATKTLFEDESEWVEGRRDNAIVYREMLSSYRRRNASAILRFGVITTSPLNKHRGVARCRACRGSLRCMSTMRVIYDAEKRVYPKSSIPAQHLFSWIMKSIFHLPPFLI